LIRKWVQGLMVLCFASFGLAQDLNWTPAGTGQLAIIQSVNAPFPHPSRMEGHLYGDSLYSFEDHYNDRSVAIFIPKDFKPKRHIDMVFYFHGWGNNIQKSISQFDLLGQFSGSGKNAIFIFPQGPKNAKDSFGGKLEDPGIFKALVDEILEMLQSEDVIHSLKPGKIILSGHSGAYHVISSILNRGGLTEHITEVYLFDALYGQLEKFGHWLEGQDGKLVNIVTPNGGTLDNSLDLLDDLSDWGIGFVALEQDTVTVTDLSSAQVVTVFTSLGHSEVINPFFQRALESSGLNSY